MEIIRDSIRATVLILVLGLPACKTNKEAGDLRSKIYYGIHVKAFGAIPNDGKDDSKAIQDAIDHAILSSTSLRRFESGTYDLSKGLVVASKQPNGEFQFVTMHLSGPIAGYTSNQAVGGTAVLRYSGKGFTIAIQSARNLVIENIVFEDNAPLFQNAKEISSSAIADWSDRC